MPDIDEMLTFLAWENSFITTKALLCSLIRQQRKMPIEFLIGSKNFIGSFYKESNFLNIPGSSLMCNPTNV